MDKWTERLEASIYIYNLRKVMIGIIFPLSVVGAIFYIIASPPRGTDFPFLKTWMSAAVGIKPQLLIPYYFTLGFVSVITAFTYGFRLGEEFKIDPLQAAVLSAISYLALCFPNWSDAAFSLDAMTEITGPNGILVAILAAIICTKFLRMAKTKGLLFNKKSGLSSLLAKGFEFLTPMTFMLALLWALGWLSASLLGEPLPIGIAGLFKELASLGSDLVRDIFASLAGSIMYIIGMDGGRINQPVYSVFMNLGGFGTLLPLIVLFLLSCSRHLKQIGKVAIIPGLFNIPYPLIFAVPVILNPIYAIPLIICPVITTIVNYLVLMSGILTVTVQATDTMPVLFSGYFSTTGMFLGILLQIFNLLIAFMIYYPFFKYHESKILAQHGTQQEKKLAAKSTLSRAGKLLSGVLGVRMRPISNNRE